MFLFKQQTAYEMRISDWSSDVCSSDLLTNIAGIYGLIYTRYADDLTFSTCSSSRFNRAMSTEVISQIYRTLGRFGLEPNLAKTQIVPPRARKVVLGLYAGDTWPRLTREFKNKMRMHQIGRAHV